MDTAGYLLVMKAAVVGTGFVWGVFLNQNKLPNIISTSEKTTNTFLG